MQILPKLPGGGNGLSIASWNATALIALDDVKAKTRLTCLRNLVCRHDVVGIQEVHGTTAQQQQYLGTFGASHCVGCSGAANPAAGGVSLLVSTRLGVRKPVFTPLVAGRAIAATICDEDESISVFICLHNFGLLPAEKDVIIDFICDARSKCQSAGGGNGMVTLLGDFNFTAEGDFATTYGDGGGAKHVEQVRDRSTWSRALKPMVEFFQPEPTRTQWREQDGRKSVITTRIDRIYSSMPSWLAVQLSISGATVVPSTQSWAKVASDHTPLSIRISVVPPVSTSARPVPMWIARHPRYAETLPQILLPGGP